MGDLGRCTLLNRVRIHRCFSKKGCIFSGVNVDVLLLIFRSESAPERFPIYFQVCSGPYQSMPGDPPLHRDIAFP